MPRKILVLFTSLLFLFSSINVIGQQPQGADPKMSKEDRDKVIRLLRESEKETLAAIEQVSEAQWKFQPAPGKWSVGEVSEHIFMAEGLLFAQVERALASPMNPEWEAKTKGKTEFIESVMAPRKGRAQAPESIVPTGKMTKAEFIKKFKEIRAKTLQFAETTDKPLKAHTTEHPFPVFNTLNAYNWLIYIPLHNQRHLKQIDEVKANASYPK